MTGTIRRITILLWLLPLCSPGGAFSETVIHTERSLYRDIIVSESFGKRCLRFDRNNHTIQACISLNNPTALAFSCTKMMLGALYLQPDPQKVLVIGLGGGTLPMAVSRILPKAEIDVVEIDPAIVRVAKKYFGFKPGGKMRVIEARRTSIRQACREKGGHVTIWLCLMLLIMITSRNTCGRKSS